MKRNKSQQCPSSLLSHLQDSLGGIFIKLPLRIQQGYTALFWSNLSIADTNRHNQEITSWKMNSKELEKLFGDVQVFRDVNTNGYHMNSKRTVHGERAGHYKICQENEVGAVKHKPTQWIKVISQGYGPRKGHKGVLNAYQISTKVQNILNEWSDPSKSLEGVPSGFGIHCDNLEKITKEKNQPEEVNILVRIIFGALMEYRFQLEIIQEEYFKKHGVSEAPKGSTLWDDIVRFFSDEEGVLMEGEEGLGGSGGGIQNDNSQPQPAAKNIEDSSQASNEMDDEIPF